MITGPGSPSVLTNMMMSIEQHVEWVADCLVGDRDQGATTIEATVEAEDGWVDHVAEVGNITLYPRADSGTWAPTSPASRGCSCPTSAASTSTAALRRRRRRGLRGLHTDVIRTAALTAFVSSGAPAMLVVDLRTRVVLTVGLQVRALESADVAVAVQGPADRLLAQPVRQLEQAVGADRSPIDGDVEGVAGGRQRRRRSSVRARSRSRPRSRAWRRGRPRTRPGVGDDDRDTALACRGDRRSRAPSGVSSPMRTTTSATGTWRRTFDSLRSPVASWPAANCSVQAAR